LDGCELAVLSACDTGAGKQAGWQGAQGLQRGFHQAGARNVLASLWSVNDPATSVLMQEFYDQLWRKQQPPPQARRRPQLPVPRHPAWVETPPLQLRAELLARGLNEPDLEARGFGKKALALPAPARGKAQQSPVAWWAAFVLSGRP